MPALVSLDSQATGFVRDLAALDASNNRSVDTVHLFYVAAGQSTPQQILSNVVRPHWFAVAESLRVLEVHKESESWGLLCGENQERAN